MVKQQIKPKKSAYSMQNAIVNYFLLVMFTFFELFLTNGYYSARKDKYHFFLFSTVALVVIFLIFTIATCGDKKLKAESPSHVPFFKLSVTDYAFVSFFIFAFITTVCSDYALDSLTGNAGRNNGLLLLSCYLAVYIIVSRYFYYKEYVMTGFMVSGCVISALAIINFFYIDLFGIFHSLDDWYVNNFGSTIGNKNYIAIYMCVFLAVALSLFVISQKTYMKVLCGASISFAYLGLLTASSNSGYIGLFATLFALLAFFARNYFLLRRLMLGLTVMFSSGLFLRFLCFVANDKHKGLEDIGNKLIYGNTIFYIVIIFAVLTVALYSLIRISSVINHWPKNTLMILVIVIFAVIIAVFAYLMYYYTFVNTTEDIGSMTRLLRFDERWGTHRGVMWIGAMEEFSSFDIFDKLFGQGCDTFYYIYEPHFGELLIYGGDSNTNCAHNEYINYLVTQGLLGLIAYLTIIISTIYKAFRNAKYNLMSIVFVMPIIAYCAQAVVNIYQPVNTPFLFIFIALSEALYRQHTVQQKL